jgi:hypothetical protein
LFAYPVGAEVAVATDTGVSKSGSDGVADRQIRRKSRHYLFGDSFVTYFAVAEEQAQRRRAQLQLREGPAAP